MLEWTGERYLPWVLGVGAEIHYEHLQRYALALQFVKGKRVIDLGSGEGYGPFLLARDAADVIGIDIDAQTVRHARSRYGHLRANLTFIEGSMTDVPLSDGQAFDVAVCFEALEHVADHQGLLAEVRRLLKPGGRLVVSTPNRHVYSDKTGYRNQFHTKELYFDEFERLLLEHFTHTAVLGQSVYPGSFTWALRGCDGVDGREFVIERGAQGYRYAEPDQKEPKYFIGIASDAPLPDIASENRLLDVSNGYLQEFIELQVNPGIRALKDEAAGLLSGLEEQRTQVARKNLELDQLRDEIQRLVAANLPPPPGTRDRRPELRRAEDRQLQRDLELAQAELARLSALADAQERQWEHERLDLQRQVKLESKAADAARRLSGRVEAQEQDLEQYRLETRRLQYDLDAQRGVADALSEQLRARDSRMQSDAEVLAGLRVDLAHTRLAVTSFVKSRSWRLTTPLRVLRSAVSSWRAPLRLELDEPALETRHPSGLIKVSGWAFGSRPVARIELVCDGKQVGVTEVGLVRPDVAAAFPHGVNAERSGFAWTWDASQLSPGSHRLAVHAFDSRGHVATVSGDLDISLPLCLVVDEPPLAQSHVSGNLKVSGWAVGPSPVVEIAVTCLDEQLGVTRAGLPRPDVAAAHPDLAEAAWSGFALTIERPRLTTGPRTLVVRAIDVQGRVATVTRQVVIDAQLPTSERARSSGRLRRLPRRSKLERFALYVSSLGNYFFGEIADLLAAGLKELGFDAETRTERDGFAEDADCHIIIAPHEFFYLGTGAAMLDGDVPERLVLVNTEQPSTPWFARALECLPKADAIWDISYECTQLIVSLGYPCRYLALGYSAGFEAAKTVAQLPEHYGTCFLEPEIREAAGAAFVERPIDVLFIGHASRRREQFFAAAASTLSRYRCYLHFSSAAEPIIPGQTTHMDTATVLGLAQRSKILLNIHHGDDLYFEWHRIVIEGIWQRALVISEPCGVAPPFQAGVDFVEAPLEELAATIDYYLSTAEGRSKAEEIIGNAFRTLTEQCRLAESLRELVLDLEQVLTLPAESAGRMQETRGERQNVGNTIRPVIKAPASRRPTSDTKPRGRDERTVGIQLAKQALLRSGDLSDEEKQVLNSVAVDVHPDDDMYNPEHGAPNYLSVGLSASRCIRAALESAGTAHQGNAILDFACGYGRVLRFLRAMFPDSPIAGGDVNAAALDFCRQVFSIQPFASRSRFRDLSFPATFDLIWAGSLMTHLDQAASVDLLKFFYRHLSSRGVCVFTTHGQRSMEWIRQKECTYGLTEVAQHQILAQFRTEGYGYADYPKQSGYGISIVCDAKITELAKSIGAWDQVLRSEHGWADHQDVYAFAKRGGDST